MRVLPARALGRLDPRCPSKFHSNRPRHRRSLQRARLHPTSSTFGGGAEQINERRTTDEASPSCWRAALALGMLVCDRAADDLQRIWPKVAATRWRRVGFPVRRVDAAQEVDHAIAGVPLWEDDDSTSPLEPPPVPPAATLSWQMLEREVRISSNTQVQI